MSNELRRIHVSLCVEAKYHSLGGSGVVLQINLLTRVYYYCLCSLDSEAAAKVMVELLGSYTEDNASQARVDAHRCTTWNPMFNIYQ